jgi:adhesin transport system outer membrane protein
MAALAVLAAAPLAAAPADDALLARLAARPAADLPARLRIAADALPLVGEATADVAIADAQARQARSRLFPTLGLDLTSADTIARDFDRPTTAFERLVPLRRTDAIGSINQLLLDWGATSARIRASRTARDGVTAQRDATRVDAIVALVGTWHEAIAAELTLDLANAHAQRLQQIAQGVGARAAAGADSAADQARAEAAAAAAVAVRADFARRDAIARARLAELFGAGPLHPERAPLPPDAAGEGAVLPQLVAARADVRAREAARSAARADRLPRLETRVSGSAFDLTGTGRPDYDVRATVTLTTRFSTGGAEAARVAELDANATRARQSEARIAAEVARQRAEAEAERDALAAALPARRTAYADAARARDLFAARFAAARGTLFDLLAAEREVLDAALALTEAELRLDVARWLLLARAGTLLDVIDGAPTRPAQGGAR